MAKGLARVNLQMEAFILAPSLRGCTLLWREVWGCLWQQEGGVGVLTSQQMKTHREGIMVLIWLPHFLLIKSEPPAHVWVPPIFRGSFSSSVISLLEHPTCTPRSVSPG